MQCHIHSRESVTIEVHKNFSHFFCFKGLTAHFCFASFRRSTMDLTATKVLSIHLDALLPPTSAELDLPHSVQVSALLGVGLLYQGTAHRRMAEVLMSEIGTVCFPCLFRGWFKVHMNGSF